MGSKLKDIEEALSKLGIKADKVVPNFADVKKAFRDKCHLLHPDRAGVDSTEAFQEVTEAVRIVFLFLVANPELQTKKVTDESTKIIKCFEKTNHVEYNDGNLVFRFDDDQYDGWIKALEKRLGTPSNLSGKDNYIFRTSSLDLPKEKMPNLGTVAVSIWHKPKDGRSKIMLQGTGFMAFLTFVIPEILKEVKAKVPEIKQLENRETFPSFLASSISVTPKSDKKLKKKAENVEEIDIKALVTGFQRLENEVAGLRENLVKVMNETMTEVKESVAAVSYKKELENIGKVVASNSTELSNIHVKIDKVIEKPDSNDLEKFISDSRTIFTSLENVSSIRTAENATESVILDRSTVEGFMKDGKDMAESMIKVIETTNMLKDNIVKRDKAINDAAANSVLAMPVLKSIEGKMSTLMDTISPLLSASFHPTGRTKEGENNQTENGATLKKPNEAEKPSEKETDKNIGLKGISEVSGRKGLFLTSSIGLKLDMYDLQEKLNSDITAFETYHIEQNVNAKDPELYLKKNLKELENKPGIDFLILATGTNDITVLDVENEDIGELTYTVCDQSKNLVHLAKEVSEKYNVDVFVVERPPRGDDNRTYSELNLAANGLYPSLIYPLKKVHYIPLPSLHKLPEKSRKNLFTNIGVPVHLKPWGLKLLRNDIVTGVKAVYKDIKQTGDDEADSFKKDGKRNDQPETRRKTFQKDGLNTLYSQVESAFETDAGHFQPAGSFRGDQNNVQYNDRLRYQSQNKTSFLKDGYNEKLAHLPPTSVLPPNFQWPGNHSGGHVDARSSNIRGGHGDARAGNYGGGHGAGNGGTGRNQNNPHENFNSGPWNRNKQPGYNQSENRRPFQPDRVQSDRNGRGQLDGQMPELVKQYLLNTLMKDGNKRY